MPTTKVYGSGSVLISSESPDRNFAVDGIYGDDESASYNLIQVFDQETAASLKFKKISSWTLYYHLAEQSAFDMSLGKLGIIASNFDLNTVTYNTQPYTMYVKSELVPSYYKAGYNVPIFSSAELTSTSATTGMNITRLRIMIVLLTLSCGIYVDSGFCAFHTDRSDYPPYLSITHGDEDIGMVVAHDSPSAGASLDKSVDNSFSWTATAETDETLIEVVTESTKFRWREKGASEFIEIDVGTAMEYTVPAGSFMSGAIEWQVCITANSGVTTTTPWQENATPEPIISGATPIDGIISKYKDNAFSWGVMIPGVDKPLLQTSAKYRWRTGYDQPYTEIELGEEQSVTIPANTFETETVQWQVEATTDQGFVVTSEWYVLSTVEPLPTAVPIAPKSTVVDGSDLVSFTWQHIISTGTPQSRVAIRLSNDGSTALATIIVETSDPFAELDLSQHCSAGQNFWSVCTANIDGAWGPWSEYLPFIVILPPASPIISVISAGPQFEISWQQSGQEAYAIMLDDKEISTNFGTKSTFRYNGYLSPGTYTVSVRIQNKYGLWSAWASVLLNTSNTESDPIRLSVRDGTPSVLFWNSAGDYEKFIVYRDGMKIAETTSNTYEDNFAIGTVKYCVRGVIGPSGFFTMSNVEKVDILVPEMIISGIDHPKWLNVAFSAEPLRTIMTNASLSATFINCVGQELPNAETSGYMSKEYQLNCAFKTKDRDSIADFEKLLGQTVCVKSPHGYRIVGLLSISNKSENFFITSYAASITQIDWQEEIS